MTFNHDCAIQEFLAQIHLSMQFAVKAYPSNKAIVDPAGFECHYYKNGNADMVVGWDAEHADLCIAFSGTNEKSDMRFNADFDVDLIRGVPYHEGFLNYSRLGVEPIVDCWYDHLVDRDVNVYLSGHSLGGAAVVCFPDAIYDALGEDISNLRAINTAGQPRTLRSRGAGHYAWAGKINRCIFENDFVPDVPLNIGSRAIWNATGWSHVGPQRWYCDDYTKVEISATAQYARRLKRAWHYISQPQKNWVGIGKEDHCAITYCNRAKKDLDDYCLERRDLCD